jgi:hypothetical protein
LLGAPLAVWLPGGSVLSRRAYEHERALCADTHNVVKFDGVAGFALYWPSFAGPDLLAENGNTLAGGAEVFPTATTRVRETDLSIERTHLQE